MREMELFTVATSSLILMTCDLEFILLAHCVRLSKFSPREIYKYVIYIYNCEIIDFLTSLSAH